MKAQILGEKGNPKMCPLSLTQVPDPSHKSDELLVQLEVCGVCRTDLHIIEGDLEAKKEGLIPGHQAIGKVIAIGEAVDGFQVGDRVGCVWMNRSCCHCEYCESGQENLCHEAIFTGYTVNGGYAEKMVLPVQFAVKLPLDQDPSMMAPLLCAGVIGYRSLKISGIKPGERLGLYGFGASAHIAIQVAKYWGVDPYVITRSKDHQAHALELGAVWAGSAEEPPPKKLHASVLFAPVGDLVPVALTHLRRGGTLAINAIHLSDIPALTYKALYHEKKISSVANVTRTDVEDLMSLATKIPLQTEIQVFPLTQANEALQTLKSPESRGAIVLNI